MERVKHELHTEVWMGNLICKTKKEMGGGLYKRAHRGKHCDDVAKDPCSMKGFSIRFRLDDQFCFIPRQEECMLRYKQLVEMVKKRKVNGEVTSQQQSHGDDEKHCDT